MDYEKIFLDTLRLADKKHLLQNDAVSIPWDKSSLVVASDAFVEDVHFRAKWYYPKALKQMVLKMFYVNCSDLYACNAIPKYAILSLGLSKSMHPYEIRELARHILVVCRECKISLVGGDTFLDSKLSFSLTLLGEKQRIFLVRKGIKKGDIIVAISGRGNEALGNVKKDLHYALRYDKINPYGRFFVPKINAKMLMCLNQIVRVGMDISDGIMLELARLSSLNKIGFVWVKGHKKRLLSQILRSPEEYQMLYALDYKKLRHLEKLALKFRVKVVQIARVRRGSFYSYYKNWHCV